MLRVLNTLSLHAALENVIKISNIIQPMKLLLNKALPYASHYYFFVKSYGKMCFPGVSLIKQLNTLCGMPNCFLMIKIHHQFPEFRK